MSKRIHIWTKGKRTVASLLLATTLLVSVAPVVQAEKSQPNERSSIRDACCINESCS